MPRVVEDIEDKGQPQPVVLLTIVHENFLLKFDIGSTRPY